MRPGLPAPLARLHAGSVHARRTRALVAALAPLLPDHARVLDVGCGDGRVSRLLMTVRPDLQIEGLEVLVRPQTQIPVTPFDGRRLPCDDASFDGVLLVDVLHHAADPRTLLREAARVASQVVVVKDHTLEGLFAGPTLRFMDWVGNAHHGVACPADYWPAQGWRTALDEAGLGIEYWTQDVRLYPWWASWVFGRSLHFIARLRPNEPASEGVPVG